MASGPNKVQLENALAMAYRQGKVDQDYLEQLRSTGEEGESAEFLEAEAVKGAYRLLRNMEKGKVNAVRRGA